MRLFEYNCMCVVYNSVKRLCLKFILTMIEICFELMFKENYMYLQEIVCV